MKKLKLFATFLYLFLLSYTFFYLAAVPAIAAPALTVTCDGTPGGCASNPLNGAIFNETNILPIDTFEKELKAINTSADNLNFAVEVVDPFILNENVLSDVITITIQEIESASVKYGPKTITQWKNDGFILLSNIPAGSERNYLFTAAFANVGNYYQGKTLRFDLRLGFDALPPPAGGPTPTSTPGPTSPPTGGPGPTSTPAPCSATAPTSAPSLAAYQSSPNSVVLTWTAVSPVTHYMIEYGITPGVYIYGAANVGNTTSFVVSGLSGGTTYYFRVAGVNNCMPGPWSNEASAGAIGGGLPPGPAAGFSVLGAITGEPLESTPTPAGEELGAMFGAACSDPYYPWWLPLLAEAIILILYFWAIWKNSQQTYWILIPLIVAIIAQIIHEILRCNCATGKWCPWFWLFNLIILIIPIAIYYLHRQKPQS